MRKARHRHHLPPLLAPPPTHRAEPHVHHLGGLGQHLGGFRLRDALHPGQALHGGVRDGLHRVEARVLHLLDVPRRDAHLLQARQRHGALRHRLRALRVRYTCHGHPLHGVLGVRAHNSSPARASSRACGRTCGSACATAIGRAGEPPAVWERGEKRPKHLVSKNPQTCAWAPSSGRARLPWTTVVRHGVRQADTGRWRCGKCDHMNHNFRGAARHVIALTAVRGRGRGCDWGAGCAF
jgi:hypothetical protein